MNPQVYSNPYKETTSGLYLIVQLVPIDAEGIMEPRKCMAKIDTGASVSAIPEEIVKEFDLKPNAHFNIGGAFDEQPKPMPAYYISLTITGLISDDIKVVAIPRKCCLIGRDLLNQLVLSADGPNQFFELSC